MEPQKAVSDDWLRDYFPASLFLLHCAGNKVCVNNSKKRWDGAIKRDNGSYNAKTQDVY
jgi:hypothetical protein